MFSKKIAFILIALVIVVVAVIALVGAWAAKTLQLNPTGPSEYSAVYLSTGDIYFGKLDWFPKPRLTNVWFLQRTADAAGASQLGIVPFKNAFWGPVDKVYLNPTQIIFWTRLRNDSQVAKAFANPELFGSAPPSSPQVPVVNPQ